jgi:CHAT domain-containing protein
VQAQSRIRYRCSGLLALLCFCFACPAFTLAADEACGAKDGSVLPPGSLITAHLQRGQAQSYRLVDAGTHQLRIVLEVDDPAFAVSVCSPDGRLSKRVSGIPVGASLMYVLAVQAGTYTVQIGAQDRGQDLAYRVRWDAAPYDPRRFARSVAAEEALRNATHLRAQSTARDIRRAIDGFEQARRDFAAAGDLQGQRLALLARGDSELRISNYAEALRSYRTALGLEPAQDRAASLVSLARVYVEQQDIPNASEYAEQALAAARSESDRRLEAAALAARGQALFLQSKDVDATRDLNAALEIARAEGDRSNMAAAMEGLANTEADVGKLGSAAEHLAQAEALWRAIGDVHNEVADSNVRAIAMDMTGSRAQALRIHRTAAQLLERMGDRRRTASAMQNVGESYIALNQPRIGLAYVERSVAQFQALHLNGGRFQGLLQLCLAHHALGETAAALRDCRSAADVVRLLHDPRQLSLSSRFLADVQMSLGQPGAERLLTSAVELSRVAKDPRGEADALRSLGMFHAGAGDNGAALRLFAQALPLSEAGEDPEGVIAAHFQIARVQRANGDLDVARAEVEAALHLAEAQRAKVGSDTLRASYFTSVRESYELYAQVLIDLHKQRPDAGLDRVALEQSEKAHARTLLDSLVERNAELTEARDPETARRMRNLRSQIEAASYDRTRLLAYGGSRKQLGDNIERIRLLNAEYDTLRSSAGETAPVSASATIPSATVDQIQQEVLDPDTTLLEYLLGDEGGIGWAITQQAVVSFALPPRRALESDVRRWHTLMLARKPRPSESAEAYLQRVKRADSELRIVGARLGCVLVGPVLSQIKTRRLVIVPDGSLESVSFAALPMTLCEHRAPEPLASRFEVTVAPSASSMVALRRELQGRPAPEPRIAVLADPVFTSDDPRLPGKHVAAKPMRPSGALAAAMRDLGWNTGIPRLPGTRLEAATIKAHASGEALVKTDFDASLSTALRPELARYRILHFATHGLLDSEQPEFSGLILSLVDRNGHDENGYLSAQDIYEQHLLADLVVLSACDSGLGPTLRGEGVVGLARAFLHAGAGRVVSSLWKVDDEATSELMRHFYDGVLRDHKPPAAALRYAQMQMMHQKRWAAPFYWAGFVLNGEWR